jgi:DDE superfamily endonuclease/Bacterial toxin 44
VRTTEDSAVAAALSVEAAIWERELDVLMRRVGGCFARVETRRTARDVVDGLLADLPRKNCWSLAEHAGHGSPDRIQHLLGRASWDHETVRAEVAAYAVENLADGVDPDLVTLVFDETGDAKKGRCTVGVQRQYSGTCGRIENCQIAVFATLGTPAGHAFVDVEPYLPRCWTSDPARRSAAGVPDDAEFATKPQLALRMTDRVLAAGVGWIAADEAYGDNPELRRQLEDRGLSYVMAVSCDTQIPTPAGKLRADRFVEQIPRSGWQILSAGRGSKGERLYVCPKICPWDHKPKIANQYSMGRRPAWNPVRPKDFYTAIPGTKKQVYYDIWSNIHYGFVGRAAGFSRDALIKGSHSPLAGKTDEGDDFTVDLGVDLYEKYGSGGMTGENLDQAVRGNLDTMSHLENSEFRVEDIP